MTLAAALAAVISVVSALVFTVCFALQQRANLVVMDSGAKGAIPVVRRREWIVGMVLQPVAFGLQALALGIGSLIVVGTANNAQLAFMAPAGAWVLRSRPVRRELLAGLVVLAGLGAFIVGTRPEKGLDAASFGRWLPSLLVTLAVFGVLMGLGWWLRAYRAALWGAATGVWGGLVAALTKQVVTSARDGIMPLLTGWATWGLLVTGVGNILWTNLALRSGKLASGLAAMACLTTVASVFLGIVVYEEHLGGGAPDRVVAAVGAVVMGVGMAAVARSPSLRALEQTPAGERSEALSHR